MKIYGIRFLAAAVALAILAGAAVMASAQQPRVISGTLYEVKDPSPRSPQWAVDLDQPLVIGETAVTEAEVYSTDTDFAALAGRKVVATGSFVQWKTKERGSFLVLEICEINPAR